jgi:hypothetical protein
MAHVIPFPEPAREKEVDAWSYGIPSCPILSRETAEARPVAA